MTLIKRFTALYFVVTNKDDISSVSLAKYIAATLKTAWSMLHKIRCAMGSRDVLYKLGNSVEMDEAFFGGEHEGKHGRGSENKTQAAVALELDSSG
ncbi:MAG: IS1595 family transposase, partial [Eubacterium sp.]|nr:IS1595 family transposase [Eubacterium sp.]